MSLMSLCRPRPSVSDTNRRATVLDLADFLNNRVIGNDFFEENYFTKGMELLVERAFKQLAGAEGGSAIFQLSQSMGGGKTHSMIGLGLLARDPQLRKHVLGDKDPAPALRACRVIGFNGRETDASGGIWGSIAAQLGKAEAFKDYVSPMLKAPRPEAWKTLLLGDPIIIFFDELPPYLEYATAIPAGDSNLATITTAALANLFIAAADMRNVVVILSDLAGSNYDIGQQHLQAAFDKAIYNTQREAQRFAVPITPVNPNGDELYHILRKRLFERTPARESIEAIASNYRDALERAVRMNLTTSSSQAHYTDILESYPFHPKWRELLGRFKENPGFQQTRGIIRLMQMVVAHLWSDPKKRADAIELIHPYEIDLNHDEIAAEIRVINPSLSEAIAKDIASKGGAEAELIDDANGTPDATETARVILLASLSTTAGPVQGLREHDLIDCLQHPGRDLSTFRANVLDKLGLRAWYLHTAADGRLFFKNMQNLAAKLRATALSLHQQVIERMLKAHLADQFAPALKDCYQSVHVLPPLDEVKLEVEKTALVIVRPGGMCHTRTGQNLPIPQDWLAWWEQQQFKNRIMFLSGSRDIFQKVLDAARQVKALESIEDDLRTENLSSKDPQWNALDQLKDRVNLQFSSALKEAFDQITYPSIENELRSSGVTLAFAGNSSGEEVVRQTLEGLQKFTTKIGDDVFRAKAEARLFGGAQTKTVLWSDFKRNAAVTTNWPFHKPSALDDLKADAIKRGLWREEGNHVSRGPFPPPEPSVDIKEASREEDGEGAVFLKITPLHAPQVVYETGNTDPTAASSPVPNPQNFRASALRYRFRAIDPQNIGGTSPVKEWTAPLRLKHKLTPKPNQQKECQLLALPKANGVVIRYTTDGTNPTTTGAVTYDGRFVVPTDCRVITAIARADELDINSEIMVIHIPRGGTGPGTDFPDKKRPARWMAMQKFDDSGATWDMIAKLEKAAGVVAHNISLTAESADGKQQVDFIGSPDSGYSGAQLRAVAEALQAIAGTGNFRSTIQEMAFPTGQTLLDWVLANRIAFDAAKIKQD